jgi:outer membrane protein TolC
MLNSYKKSKINQKLKSVSINPRLSKAAIYLGLILLHCHPVVAENFVKSYKDDYQEIVPELSLKAELYSEPETPSVNLKSEYVLDNIGIDDFFYKAHIETNFYPIKLDTSFKNPIEIGLEEILEQSIANNINLNIARLDSKIAKWQFWKQFSDNLPDFTVGLGNRNLDGTFYLNSRVQGQINENIANTSMRLDYRVFNGGTTLFLTLAEKFYKQATELQEQETYNKTLLDSIHFYNNLLSSQLKLATGAKALESMKANLDLSSKFFNAGTGTKLDQMIATAELAKFQKNLIDSEAAFRTSEIDLAQHLRINLDSALQIRNEKIRVFNLVQENLSIEEFLETALKKNPQILKSLAIKEAALKEGLSKVGNLLPKLDIYADRSGNGGEFNNLFHTTTLAFNVNVKVGENLGLGNFSDIAKAKLDIKKAKLVLEQEQTRIEKELRKSYIKFQQAKSSIDAINKELEASEEALRLAKLRYRNGIEVFANLIQKESSYFNAQSKYIDSINAYNSSQAEIAYFMGSINVSDLLKLITQERLE